MIANSELKENESFFSHPLLVCPAGFLKNQLRDPSPLQFFGNFIVPSEKGQGDRKLC